MYMYVNFHGSFALSTDCGSLPPPAFGSVQLLNGTTTLGSVANYACNPGYISSTSMSRVCTDTSVWSGSAPVCTNSEYNQGSLVTDSVCSHIQITVMSIGVVRFHMCLFLFIRYI